MHTVATKTPPAQTASRRERKEGDASLMLTVTLRPDPLTRRDGRCAVCKEPKPTPNVPSLRASHLAQLAADPFCSAVCARTYHGVDDENEGAREHDATIV